MTDTHIADLIAAGKAAVEHREVREFNEGKVKRDGRGKFASKAERLAEIDGDWIKNKRDTMGAAVLARLGDMSDMYKAAARQSNVPVSSIKTPPPGVVDMINEELSKPKYSSPSGAQQLQTSVNPQNPNEPIITVVPKAVKHAALETDVVGDMDEAELRKLIMKHFGLSSPADAKLVHNLVEVLKSQKVTE